MSNSPTVKRRRLSAELRALRVDAKLTAEQAAHQLEWAPSKVTRIERNEWKRPDVRDIRDLLDLYGVTDEARREELLALARDSRQRGWWVDYQDVLSPGSVAEFEATAAQIHMFEALLIPGLLQTADYAAAVFRGGQVLDQAVIDRHVAARLARQEILEREDPPHLWAVIDEAALRKQVGGVEVMRHQLEHIVAMCSRPNIAIQVVPDAAGAHAAMAGPFVIYEYASTEDATLVYLETGTGDVFLEKPQEVIRYNVKFDHVCALALSEEASVSHLRQLANDL
ncbi:helix-turn-helix transcriptional regulator [Sphaerisporangium sp. TRM90804]|uniref:helix-turn-helix domain-containing protein n=1 Tax=Sphaerisporangium sp. TRM90804 TaxID=3031113 RepID=UPI0024491A1C|nr:helix-turn-helix transcriptional regulator [Sphaerisporangium sp. TRM90804]MDH2424700.1 helix-turn-helix transcriptional regulator [Sphaerisporangium sp. TRM90804]